MGEEEEEEEESLLKWFTKRGSTSDLVPLARGDIGAESNIARTEASFARGGGSNERFASRQFWQDRTHKGRCQPTKARETLKRKWKRKRKREREREGAVANCE